MSKLVECDLVCKGSSVGDLPSLSSSFDPQHYSFEVSCVIDYSVPHPESAFLPLLEMWIAFTVLDLELGS